MKEKLFRLSLRSIVVFGIIIFISPVFNSIKAQFVRGADIGWLQQMEATGYKFYDSDGIQKNCLQILKNHGINTVRLRVWVNPSNDPRSGHCSTADVVEMALRAKKMGMQILIDFHYSDSWADPQKQNKPAAWTHDPFPKLVQDVFHFTYHVLDTLKSVGIVPQWVQVGNEITNGMLWPDGSTNNWPQLAQLLNAGYKATKKADPGTQVIIHLDQGNNNKRFRTFFDNAKKYNVHYDIIGASYYPFWLGTDYTATINDLGNNLDDMVKRYGKDVMVVEVGGQADHVQNTYNMLKAVIKKVKEVPDHKGLGVIYWEPEGAQNWSGYALSCWGNDGKPTKALDAFIPEKVKHKSSK
ncbi:glycoside hydrolase family 53 protein [Microbacter margulisiae]|uniref:Arabinogalactan endo-beta-1,4-galactanase n=1 Tax=Microbacter margulisiae TaxID=1350067 RepID=A0A7W5DTN0_9PORP|nr:glycosyl hydrolase 53 family protein [Microbacter margulisiae]MBB3188038.1 arabinogalactan endo-1,4-beta-galactosidase [Microbacter margulisiae]